MAGPSDGGGIAFAWGGARQPRCSSCLDGVAPLPPVIGRHAPALLVRRDNQPGFGEGARRLLLPSTFKSKLRWRGSCRHLSLVALWR
jgi:hypothetical protein